MERVKVNREGVWDEGGVKSVRKTGECEGWNE